MSLPLAVALITLFDLSILAALAWFMSRPSKLTPHVSARHPGRRFSLVHGEAQRAERQREEQIAA